MKCKNRLTNLTVMNSNHFNGGISNVSGHFLSGPNSGLVTSGTNTSGSTMTLRNSLGARHSVEAPTFHDTVKTAAGTANKLWYL